MTDILLKTATEKELLEEVMKRKGIQFTLSNDPNQYPYKLMLVDKKTLSALKHGGQLKTEYERK